MHIYIYVYINIYVYIYMLNIYIYINKYICKNSQVMAISMLKFQMEIDNK